MDGRPRCTNLRTQTVRERIETTDGALAFRTIRRPAPCGMLLDAAGRCWFCGHQEPMGKPATRKTDERRTP